MLPNLPKINKKKEADFGLLFRKWWVKHGMDAGYELKDSRGKDSIAFSEVSEKQEYVGLASKSRVGILIRVERGTEGAQDYIGLKNSASWIVIKYPKFFCIIDIENFLAERDRSKRKSLTSDRAKEIATIIV